MTEQHKRLILNTIKKYADDVVEAEYGLLLWCKGDMRDPNCNYGEKQGHFIRVNDIDDLLGLFIEAIDWTIDPVIESLKKNDYTKCIDGNKWIDLDEV